MKNKGEQGSITLFVVLVCMFMVIMLVAFMMNIQSKKQAQNKEIDQIIQSYEQNEQEMEEIYSTIENE